MNSNYDIRSLYPLSLPFILAPNEGSLWETLITYNAYFGLWRPRPRSKFKWLRKKEHNLAHV